MPILYLEIHDRNRFLEAIAEITKFGTFSTLRFSPEGLSLTTEVDGTKVAGLRILAGGCDRFSCSESRSAVRVHLPGFLSILFIASRGRSTVSISIEIDPPGADSAESNAEKCEEGSTPATLTVFWFDPPNSAAQEAEEMDDSCKLILRLSKVEKEIPLMKYDESVYEAVAGLSPAGWNLLDEKLEHLMKEKRDDHSEDEIRIMILITPAKLGFFTCGKGWIQEGDDDVVEVLRKDGTAEDMRIGIYSVGYLRKHIRSTDEVKAGRLWISKQDDLPMLLSFPIGDGKLGSLYFFCFKPPPPHIQMGLLSPLSQFTFDFVRSLSLDI